MELPNQLELQTLFSGFLFEAGLSSVSVKNYLSDLRHFLSFCASISSQDEPPTVQEIFQSIPKYVNLYTDEQRKSFTPQNTVNRRLASIRRFSTFLTAKFGLQSASRVSNTIPKSSLSEQNNNQDKSSDSYPSLSKILEQFKLFLAREKKTYSTIKNYISDLNHFFAWSANETPFIDQKLENILSESHLNTYVTYLKLGHTSTSVINRRQSSIKKFAKYCFSQNYLPENPFETKPLVPQLAPLSWLERFKNKRNTPKKASKNRLVLLYHRYNALPFTPYLHLAILVLATSAMVIFGYNQAIKQAPTSSAAVPTVPKRQLSFQGRLTDSSGTPITTSVNVVFKLWNASSDGTQLYTSSTCSVSPDSNGIFNTLIGDGTCGQEIASTVFTENRDVFLEVTVGAETLTPRQQIATVGYALNSETLQGYPASASATINTVPVVDGSGNINLAAASPTINSTSGTFTLNGQALTLSTAANSGGNIVLQPDSLGAGQVQVLGSTTSTDTLRIENANLTSGSLISGYVGNNTATGNLLSLTSGSSETDRFLVGANGRTIINTNGGTDSLFSASSAGITRFTIASNGDLFATGTLSGLTGLTVNSGDVSLPNNTINNSEISELDWTKLQNYPSACPSGQVVQAVGDTLTCVDMTPNLWQRTDGSLAPLNITDSLNLGSTATTSALIHLAGTTDENSWINTGNFGIGTTTPADKVEVAGNVTTTGGNGFYTYNLGHSGDTNREYLRIVPNSNTYYIQSLGYGTGSGRDIQFYATGFGNIMRLKASNGYVGLGTTTPNARLDIVGDASSSGSLVFRGTNPTIDILDGNRLDIQTSAGGDAGLIPKLTISNDGNVGVGLTNPAYKLDVTGDINLTGGLYDNGSAGNPGQILSTTGTGIAWIDAPSTTGDSLWQENSSVVSPQNILDSLNLGDTSTNSATVHLTGTPGDNSFINTGFFGLGTTNPTALLDVAGNASTSGSLTFRGADPSIVNILNGSRLDFQTSVGGNTSLTTSMTLANNGYLGLGLTNPAYKLDVTGDINLTGGLYDNGSAGNPGQILSTTGTGIAWIDAPTGANSSPWDWNTGVIYPFSITDAVNLGNAATNSATVHLAGTSGDNSFFNTGNLGIGLTNPAYKLDVTGDINLTGAIYDNGSAGTPGQILSTTGTGIAWIDAPTGATNYWQQNGGVLSPLDINQAINLGNTATNSATVHLASKTGDNSFVNTGNFGIGVTNPGSKLTVNGTLTSSDGDINLNNNSDYTTNINTGTSVGAVNIGGGNGSVAINSNTWDISSTGAISGITTINMSGQLTSTLATGTAPFAVSSTTVNTNLNADLLDGQHASYFAPLANISGTTNRLAKFSGANSVGNASINDLYNNVAMTIDAGGNIGIGTTTPGQLLQVGTGTGFQVNGDGAIMNANGATISGSVRFSSLSTGLLHADSSGYVSSSAVNLGSDITGTLPIANGGTNNTTFTSGKFIAYDGTSLSSTVYDASSFEQALTFSNGLTRITNAVKLGGTLVNDTTIDQSGYSMAFIGNGNVGIGLTNPSYKLDVTGDVNLTGALRTSGNAGTSGQILTSTGTGLVWENNLWQRTSGSLAPYNITDSLNLGSAATSSALVHLAGTTGENSFFINPVAIGFSSAIDQPIGGYTFALETNGGILPQTTNVDHLGASTHAWKDIYLTEGIYQGGTGTEAISIASNILANGDWHTSSGLKVGSTTNLSGSNKFEVVGNASISATLNIGVAAVFTPQTSAPTSTTRGTLYYDNTSNDLYLNTDGTNAFHRLALDMTKYSSSSASVANASSLNLAYNSAYGGGTNNDISVTGWVYNTLTSAWENISNFSHNIIQNLQNQFDLAGNSKIRTQSNLSDIELSPSVDTGTGADGAITITADTNINTATKITGRSCADGGDAVNYSVSSLTSTSATLGSTPSTGCLSAGDEVLLINLQGTSGYVANTGNYETLRVASISTNTVYFTNSKQKYYGNGTSDDTNIGTGATNQKVMLQRVPNYSSVTVNSSYNFYPSAYDYTTGKGGVLFFRANGTVSVAGTIHANAMGYAAGNGTSYGNNAPAGQGLFYTATSTDGAGGSSTSPNGYAGTFSGGGGGGKTGTNPAGTGGAGSAIAGASGGGGGGGVYRYDSSNAGYGGGGGGGGNSTGGGGGYGRVNGTAGTNSSSGAGGNAGASSGNRGGGGGGGMSSVDSSTLSRLTMGGGGGGGGGGANASGTSYAGTNGGNGGGIIAISANLISVSGNIKSVGAAGTDAGDNRSGAGGGGAGGSVKLTANSLSLGTNLVSASGGVGGAGAATYAGGTGGTGYTAIYYTSSYTGSTSSPTATYTQQPYYPYGVYSSSPIATTNSVSLDKIRWEATPSAYGKVEFQTRTGNTTDPTDGSWESWMPAANTTTCSSPNCVALETEATNYYTNWTGTNATVAVGDVTRNVNGYEDDNQSTAANLTKITSSTNGGYAEATVGSTDLSNYDYLTLWVRASNTGNTVKIGMGESAATEQEETITIDTADTWQKVYWDLSDIPVSSRNAITKLRLTNLTTSSNTIYLGYVHAEKLLTTSSGSTITSTPKNYIQYRAVMTTTNTSYQPSFYNVNIDYNDGYKIVHTDDSNNVELYNYTGTAQRLRLEVIVFGADLAEYYGVDDQEIGAGDVVAVTGELDNYKVPILRKSASKNDSGLIGIISSNAGQTLGIEADDRRLLALTGRVPVKVASNSAAIKYGDFLTSSNEPGKAKKATIGEKTIGTALESWDPDSGKSTVMVLVGTGGFLTPALADLNAYTLTAKVNLEKTSYEITDSAGEAIENLGVFSQFLAANFQAGVGVIKELTVDNLTVKNTLISPIANIDELKVINATVSGTLYADNIEGQTIDSLHSQINLLNDKYSTASSILADLQAKYGSYGSLLNSTSETSMFADPLSLSSLATMSASIPKDLALNTLSTQTIISEDVLVNGSIFSNTLSSSDADLFIQPTGEKPVHLLANLMTLYPNGKVLINGDLLITGTLFAQGVSVGTSSIATESANFASLVTKGLVIAADSDMTSSTSSAQINSNATIGTATIASGSSEIAITNTKVTPTTLIYITPTSDTTGKVLYVKSKETGLGFVVSLAGAGTIDTDISFNYWLVETK